MRIRVLLVDDNEYIRATLRAMVSPCRDLEIAGEAPDGAVAVALAADLLPHVVVMDVNMPRVNGIDATRRITRRHGDAVQVVAFTLHDETSIARRMAEAGARSYLRKDCSPSELLAAMREAGRRAIAARDNGATNNQK